MKIAFTLESEVAYARFIAYAIEHYVNVANCLNKRRDRENNGYFIDWKHHKAYCKPISMLRRDGYYISDDARFSYTVDDRYALSVAVDYEHIYN